MKKIIALILAVCTLFALWGCKDKEFEPVESTEEEARVIATFEYENKKYELKYELYRALFLNMAKEYDGGDKSFWSKPEAADAISEINSKIFSFAGDIFAAIHLSRKIGYDPYSSDAEKLIDEYIATSVNGDGESFEGFGGDYSLYLKFLKDSNLNYSTQVLLYRYAIAYDKVIEYYRGNVDKDSPTANMKDGALEYTKDDVLAFYESDDSVRVSLIVINSLYISKEKAESKRDAIAAAATEEEALSKAIGLTSGDANDILNGIVIGKNSLDHAYYSDVTKAAFELELSETSELIELSLERRDEYWILYRMQKTDEHFEKEYENIASVYVSQKIGEILDGVKSSLLSSMKTTDDFESLDHSSIKMQ